MIVTVNPKLPPRRKWHRAVMLSRLPELRLRPGEVIPEKPKPHRTLEEKSVTIELAPNYKAPLLYTVSPWDRFRLGYLKHQRELDNKKRKEEKA